MAAPEATSPTRLLDLHPAPEPVLSVRSLMRNAGQIRDAALVLTALSYGLSRRVVRRVARIMSIFAAFVRREIRRPRLAADLNDQTTEITRCATC
jgi:hypothetical protein